jgi:uncharacterized protein YggE
MKKLISTAVFFLTFISLTKGQQVEAPIINVTGSSKVNVKPDLSILYISVSEIRPKMSEALKALGIKSNHYNDLLKKLGFNEKDIKTTSFNVAQNRIERNHIYIDSGYVASQKIRLEIVYNPQILQKIVSEFSKSEKPIDFSFDFELSEQLKQKVQTQILEYAVKDAKEKANNIARSAGIKLLKIKEINYGSWSKYDGMEQVERN